MEKTPFNKLLRTVKDYTYPNRLFSRKLMLEASQANLEPILRDLGSKLDQLHALEASQANLEPTLQDLGSKLDQLHARVAWDSNRDLQNLIRERQLAHPNPLASFGRKCFSQSDEDGITLEIIRRLDLRDATYCEFGVGNGLENNTLLLAAIGWRGFWVGGEDLAFSYKGAKRFSYTKTWVTRENIVELFQAGCQMQNFSSADVVSLDLDGNDLFLCGELLSSGVNPALFIVEYNGRFIPPIRFCIDYSPEHVWRGDDYYGASLASFNDLFERNGYKLVCCNAASGANAFFVRSEFAEKFSEVPSSMEEIYAEPHFYLSSQYGHPQSVRSIEKLIHT